MPKVLSLNIDGIVEEVVVESSPIGSILPFRFSVVPDGYLALDGSTYNVDDYPTLGVLYGGTSGGTFTVDDARNKPLWGSGTNSEGDVVGTDTVDLSHSHTTSGSAASNGAHTHTISGTTNSTGAHTHNTTVSGTTASLLGFGLGTVGDEGTYTSTSSGNHSHTTTGTAASNGAHTHTTSGTTNSQLSTIDKLPSRLHVNWIIRAL